MRGADYFAPFYLFFKSEFFIMKIGRITINTQAAVNNPDEYARLFASVFFFPVQITASSLTGKTEYIGHCHLFDDVEPEKLIPAYDIKQAGKVERKTLTFIKKV